MDGSLARVRQTQRPLYGFYLDHTLDVITEFIMFMGAGLSALLRPDIALLVFIAYLMLTLNVTINTHLKGEFRLTYAKLGPTEFRLIMIIVNTLLIYIRPLREFSTIWNIGSCSLTMSGLDIIALGIFALLLIIYVVTFLVICGTMPAATRCLNAKTDATLVAYTDLDFCHQYDCGDRVGKSPADRYVGVGASVAFYTHCGVDFVLLVWYTSYAAYAYQTGRFTNT